MGSLALNSSFPDGLNSEKYDSPPQLTNRSPFLVVCALPVAAAVRPSGWFTDLISVAVWVARSRLIVTARLDEYRVDCPSDSSSKTVYTLPPSCHIIAPVWRFTL